MDKQPNASTDVIRSTGTMIVISNRLPFVLQKNDNGNWIRKPSAGGLVTAMAPVVKNGNGFWVGWPGVHLEDHNEPIPESDPDDITPIAGLRSDKVIAVQMNPEVFESFYNGFCNGSLWPLMHCMPLRVRFEDEHWNNYVLANGEFAKCTMEALRRLPRDAEPALIWLHDYHVVLSASLIRRYAKEENISCNLGFFLHTPFPPWDIFRLLPWSKEILQGMLACDFVGFHIEVYCSNFVDCCQRILGCKVDRENLLVEQEGRTVSVRPLPIGIPYDSFVELARKAPELISVNQKVILGVDRLDYTKGVAQRMLAYEKLLEKYPEYEEKVSLFQVSVPSRIEVKEYKKLKEEIDQLVGRINGRFGNRNWMPIKYMYRNFSQSELVSFYKEADVCLVTPLRDGMNLVAKEFVACQINTPPGVLILSQFTGAAETMQEALICNPYHIEDLCELIHNALTMTENEKIERMNELRTREKMKDVTYWTRSCLSFMGCLHD